MDGQSSRLSHQAGQLCVWVTRPGTPGEALCEHIRAAGDEAVYFPTIEFIDPPDLAAYNRSISDLGYQDWLIFVSPQAVQASVPAIRRAWPVMPSTLQFAALGAGTARALHEAGYQAAVHPAADAWHSEGLAALPEFRHVAGKKIAIIRGVGGREQLEALFVERGAAVISVMAYQRQVPSADPAPMVALLHQDRIQRIVCTSFESVRNLKTMIGDVGWDALKKIPLIVVSDRIKYLAGDLSFQTIWIAANASHEAILQCLLTHR